MDKFIINGNRDLAGEIEVRGSKNAAGPCLAAVLLTKEECIIDNLPLIEDIKSTIFVLESLGVKTEWLSERKLKLRSEEIHPENIDLEKVSKTRMSVVLFGSLLGKVNEFKISAPGGDVIGLRPITIQLKALEKIGAHIEKEGVESLHGCQHSVEPDHLEAGTFIVIGALTPGRVVVKNINYDYLDLFLHKLEEMGVNFDRGENQITVFYSPFLKPIKV